MQLNNTIMKTYKLNDEINEWDFENGYFLNCNTERIGKFINHYELYKKIVNLSGDIAEFGVFKGVSLTRFLSFRNILENQTVRKVYGFDIFGKFPTEKLNIEKDVEQAINFETEAGLGISKNDLNNLFKKKGFSNYDLIEGDINLTLPKFIEENLFCRFSIIHVDVDVYEPTKLILDNLWDKLNKGGVLILDDYGTFAGETTAVDEFFNSKETILKLPFSKRPSYIIKK